MDLNPLFRRPFSSSLELLFKTTSSTSSVGAPSTGIRSRGPDRPSSSSGFLSVHGKFVCCQLVYVRVTFSSIP